MGSCLSLLQFGRWFFFHKKTEEFIECPSRRNQLIRWATVRCEFLEIVVLRMDVLLAGADSAHSCGLRSMLAETDSVGAQSEVCHNSWDCSEQKSEMRMGAAFRVAGH